MLKRSRLPATTLHNGVIASCCALLLTEMGLKKTTQSKSQKRSTMVLDMDKTN